MPIFRVTYGKWIRQKLEHKTVLVEAATAERALDLVRTKYPGPIHTDHHLDPTGSDRAYRGPVTKCRSCQASIIWFTLANNRNMPVDADSVEATDVIFDSNKHRTHFSTCPHAAQHRKKA